MRRTLIAAVAAVLTLTACGNTGTGDPVAKEPASPAESSSASSGTTPTAAPTPDVADSLCAALDPAVGAKLVKALGQKQMMGSITLGATAANVPMETCNVSIGQDNAGTPLTLGWSAQPGANAITTMRGYQNKTNGRYTPIKDLKVPGAQGAFLVNRTGYAQVGDRMISVLFQGPEQPTPQLMTQLLGLVASQSSHLPEWEPTVTAPACAGADAEVAAVLGGEPTFVRGQESGAEGPACLWSTGDDTLTVSRMTIGNASQTLDDDVELFGGKKIDGLGHKAIFVGGEDGMTVKVLASADDIVSFSVPPLMSGDQASLSAVAKKLLPNFLP